MSPDEYEEYKAAIKLWRAFNPHKEGTTKEIFDFYEKNHHLAEKPKEKPRVLNSFGELASVFKPGELQ